MKCARGSIGYAQYQYAVKRSIAHASVLNAPGRLVRASSETITASCQATEAPQWNKFSASLTNMSGADSYPITSRSEEHTSELQSHLNLVCRLLLEKKKTHQY